MQPNPTNIVERAIEFAIEHSIIRRIEYWKLNVCSFPSDVYLISIFVRTDRDRTLSKLQRIIEFLIKSIQSTSNPHSQLQSILSHAEIDLLTFSNGSNTSMKTNKHNPMKLFVKRFSISSTVSIKQQ